MLQKVSQVPEGRPQSPAHCLRLGEIRSPTAPVPAPWSPYHPLCPVAKISLVRPLILILVLLAALPACDDVIHLKNGRAIWADQVRETKNRVEYDLGEDTYAIPKSSVDHIEAGGVSPVRAGTANSNIPDITPPTPSFRHRADVVE